MRRGAAADLVVLDPAALADTATFEDPARFPHGVDMVVVGGRVVVDGESYDASARAGMVLRG